MQLRNSKIWNIIDIVNLLLEHGADVNLTNNRGRTALMLAARNSNKDSNVETVKLLLEYGANVNVVNNDRMTALMLAACYSNEDSNIETVKLLLEHRANVNLVDNEGWTALMKAARNFNECSNIETVKLLLEHGANVKIKNNDGKTFFNYFDNEHYSECLDIIFLIEHQKLCMKKILKEIPRKSYDLIFQPNSLRVKLMGIKWCQDFKLSDIDPDLLDYFGIIDEDILKLKINDNAKNFNDFDNHKF